MEWQEISDDNIKKAEQELLASTTLRGVINSVLEQTQQDLLKQRQTVNLAFYKRIQEVTNAKKTLEEHLKQVYQVFSFLHKLTHHPSLVYPIQRLSLLPFRILQTHKL